MKEKIDMEREKWKTDEESRENKDRNPVWKSPLMIPTIY